MTMDAFNEAPDAFPGPHVNVLAALMPAAIYTCDAEGRITFFNSHAARIWGREPRLGDEQEKFCGSFRMWTPDGVQMEPDGCPMAEALRHGRVARDVELIIEQANGQRLAASVNIDPIFDRDGNIIGAINVFVDVTDRKRNDVLLARQREALELALNGQSLEASLGALSRAAMVQYGQDVRAAFYLAAPDGSQLRHIVGIPPEYADEVGRRVIRPDSLACSLAPPMGEPVLIADVKEEPRWEPWRDMADRFDYRGFWSFPIHSRKGEFVGAFELYWRHPRQATPWDADYADHIVQSAAIIIAHATEAIRRETAEAALSDELETMRALHKLSTIALGGGELTPVLEAALDATMTFLAADFGNIQLYDPATETLRIAVQRGFDQPFLDHFSHVDAHGSSACGLALADRRRRIVTDTETDPDFAPHRAAAREAGYRSVQSTPLFSASGEVLGMLSTHFRSCRLLTDLDEQMTDLFAREVARAIDRIRHQTALRESEARFQQFAKASSGGLWIRDAETLIMEYISPAMTTIYGIGQDILLGHLDQWVTSILPEDRSLALKHIEHARKGEATVHDFRIQRATDQAFRWITNTDFPLFDEHGKVQRIGGIAEDITDAKLAIEHQGVLLAELQHRVRNILAMIRSTIRQTSRNKTNLDEFICQLMGRLDAMARTQAMLSRSPSPQVDLEEIVREELLAQTAQNELCSLRGQPVWLPPKAAEVLTLGFHELAANSVKFGVLGKGSGKIAVTWRRERKDRDWVTILWQETGIHPLVSDAVPGFGTELITQLLPYELEGEAVMEFSTNGLKVRMGFPLAQGTSVFQTDAYWYGEPWV